MSTAQSGIEQSSPPTLEKSDEDRIQQIEKDLCFLYRQVWKIYERLHYVREKLDAVGADAVIEARKFASTK